MAGKRNMKHPMQALRFHGPEKIRHEEIRRPELKRDGDVKVQVGAAGICGSDLHVYKTGAYVTQLPVVMGHEFSGIVLETGPGVTHLKPGDHVVGDSRVPCGQCEFCMKGRPNLCNTLGFLGEVCDGAFAEETVVDQGLLVGIDPSVPFRLAALAEPLAVALHAVSRVELSRFSRALVIGAGPIGALIHCLLKRNGMESAFIYDRSDYRRRTVAGRFPESVGEPEGVYDLVFETTGSTQVPKKIIPDILAKKGTLVMVGLYGAPLEFEFTQLVEHEWTLTGCAAFSTELSEAADLLAAHGSDFEYIVSHQLPLKEGQTAFDLLLDGAKRAMKVVFVNTHP
jgi:(R,R)-butanediol dehydrogenase/meso-butanediol dehydrogenase/diacetyl reductase